jgi:alpha-glucosidase
MFFLQTCRPQSDNKVSGPNGKITLNINLVKEGKIRYDVLYGSDFVIKNASLGIIMEDADFSSGLKLNSVSEPEIINDSYTMQHGKKKEVNYNGVRRVFHFKNKTGNDMDIIVQISNDGVGFRYYFPGNSGIVKKISKELTSYNFPDSTKTWIQPRATSKSGWSQVNPSYEEHYIQDILLTQLPVSDSGWVFPALFKTGKYWLVLTETFPQGNYCGSHLLRSSNLNEFSIAFPEKTEGFPNGAVNPESELPWYTPWRIIAIGDNPGTIAESTLGTDFAEPSKLDDISYVKPGRASWSWVLMKDPSVNYKTQKEFIDYASDMGWEYCLVDGMWDTQIGWDKIKELADYAAKKQVGLLLWYNSAGDWNTTYQTPKNKLLTSEDRNAEFAKLKEIGIKGIKVDFFGGDGQSMMAYYIDILKDANKYQLMINCHGATLPRGLERTYPNLVSMEAIRGLEYATFTQETADKVPAKSTTIPFTRNVFDPMDFTPVCFNEYDNNLRVTGNGAELAQAVVFLSGVQHYAETPVGMSKVPVYVKQAMKDIPVSWDETKFIDGYPGEYVVIARQKGNKWYIAGINGTNETRSIDVIVPFALGKKGNLITDGETNRSFRNQEVEFGPKGEFKLTLIPNGGFLVTVEI